ncbi:putative invertase inhibitor [Curcuma longa]|uniref:putative invertase inhibitor n=1 Tax=Curcuma longa TaxID=136217 RepID=UPI003D9DD607
MMKHWMLPSLLLLFFLRSISGSSSNSSPNIEAVCENVQDSYVDKKYCIRTLSSDVRSRGADARGLGVIAAELTAAKAVAIKSHIEQARRKARDRYGRRLAEAALEIFSDVIPSVRWAAESIKGEFYASAGAVLFVALDAASACVGVVELGKAADEYVNLALLAQAIAVHLH